MIATVTADLAPATELTAASDALHRKLPPLFAGVHPNALGHITPGCVHLYQQGEALFHEGEEAEHLVVVLSGTVDVCSQGESLVQRGAGEIVGEQAILEGVARSATVVAVGQVQGLRLPRLVVEELLKDTRFARNLLTVMSAKLSDATHERAVRFGRERLLFNEFRAHVSSQAAQRLAGTGIDYGRPRTVDAVVLFSDIRNFTATSGTLEPEVLAGELTAYFDRVVDLIHSHGGIVDKFIGDAVMAFWGGFNEMSHDDAARRAFACAQQMVRIAGSMNLAGSPIHIGVGLNSGEVFMGNVGGAGKRQFTVLGAAVNLAARFESASKSLSVDVVVGDRVVAALTEMDRDELTHHDAVPIKGADAQQLFGWSKSASSVVGESQ